MVYLRPCTPADVAHVWENLRAADRREVETVGGDLTAAFLQSECYALFTTSQIPPVGLCGVTPDTNSPGFGIVWFVATDQLRGSQFSLLRESKRWLEHLSRTYPEGLHNYADTRNERHLRWCALTGFTSGGSVDIHGVPFRYIHRPPGAHHLV